MIRPLGKGGEGSVYLAVQESVYKFYAVKVLEKSGGCFSKESIELWKRLSHPGLPEIADIIEEEEKLCLVMDYVEGSTLEQEIETKGVPSLRKITAWGIQICETLTYLHGQNPPVIFGDLKPSNLVLQREKAVLVDLGSAAMVSSRTPRSGTEEYFPPWKRRDETAVGVDTDLYGLGKTLEFLASGGGRIQPVSRELKKIVDGCTAQRESDRYRTAKECRAALKKLHNRGWMRMAMLLLAFCVVALAGRTLGMGKRKADAARQYEELLAQAEKSMPGEREELLVEAICLNPAKETGYLMLLESFLEDARLSEEEDISLRTVLKEGDAGGKCNEEALRENVQGYVQVSYEMGMAYWYFYEEEGGKTYAGSWFRKVLEMQGNAFAEEKYLVRSRIYEKIGSYRAKLWQSSKSGEKMFSYRAYWEDLMELFQIQESEADSTVTVLFIWKEILLQMAHYTLEFMGEGVTETKMRGVLEAIRKRMDAIGEEGQAVKRQKEEIEAMIEMLTETLEGMGGIG